MVISIKMNIMKKVLAVANGVISGLGGDQNLRVWAELNGLDFMAFNSIKLHQRRR